MNWQPGLTTNEFSPSLSFSPTYQYTQPLPITGINGVFGMTAHVLQSVEGLDDMRLLTLIHGVGVNVHSTWERLDLTLQDTHVDYLYAIRSLYPTVLALMS